MKSLLFLLSLVMINGHILFSQVSYFQMVNQLSAEISIDSTYSNEIIINPFKGVNTITGLSFSGKVIHNEANSLVRLILIDENQEEYMIFESYPLIYGMSEQSYDYVCEETAILNNIKPVSIKIVTINADLTIIKLHISNSQNILFSHALQKETHDMQVKNKIQLINNNIKSYNLHWIADSSSSSHLMYRDKKIRYSQNNILNTYGIEYYRGGVFDIILNETKGLKGPVPDSSLYTDSFDWRNRHGAMDTTSQYYNNSANNNGWVTCIKDQANNYACLYFAIIATLEAHINLYYNQFLHLDLSEQEFGECAYDFSYNTYQFTVDYGIVNEACLPYNYQKWPASTSSLTCDSVCATPDYRVFSSGYQQLKNTYDDISTDSVKKCLIEYGPLVCVFGHSICLVGYYNDYNIGKTVWIYKDSFGTSSGVSGYIYASAGYVPDSGLCEINRVFKPVTCTDYSTSDIACLDYDNDGFYNWGIDSKPAHCPASPDWCDCDDSDNSFGPMDKDGSCSRYIPYYFSFEDTLEDWRQSRIDDFNWTINTGSTPTASTGPSSASLGNDYIYTEATGNIPSKEAVIYSPSIYLNGECSASLQFSYHMYGADMGSLAVKVSTDGGKAWSADLWSTSGNQGNDWDTATVSLSSYSDEIIKIKFTGTTGSGETSDMAIDDIQVTYASQTDWDITSNDTIDSYSHKCKNINIKSGAKLVITSNGFLDLEPSVKITVENGELKIDEGRIRNGLIEVQSNGVLTIQNGGILDINDGDYLQIQSGGESVIDEGIINFINP